MRSNRRQHLWQELHAVTLRCKITKTRPDKLVEWASTSLSSFSNSWRHSSNRRYSSRPSKRTARALRTHPQQERLLSALNSCSSSTFSTSNNRLHSNRTSSCKVSQTTQQHKQRPPNNHSNSKLPQTSRLQRLPSSHSSKLPSTLPSCSSSSSNNSSNTSNLRSDTDLVQAAYN